MIIYNIVHIFDNSAR